MNIAELVSRTQPGEDKDAAQLFIQITAHSPASQKHDKYRASVQSTMYRTERTRQY